MIQDSIDWLINKVYDETGENFKQKVQPIMDWEDLSEKEARSEAKEQSAFYVNLYRAVIGPSG